MNENTNVGDRGLPSVNDSKPKNNNRMVMIIFVVLVMAIGGIAIYWTLNKIKSAAKSGATPKAQQEQQTTIKTRKFDEGVSASPDATTGATAPAPGGGTFPPAPAEVRVPAVEGTGATGKAAPINVVSTKGGTPPGGNDFGGGRKNAANGQVMTSIPVQKGPSPYDSGFVVNGGVQPGGAVEGGVSPAGGAGGVRPSEVLTSITGANAAGQANANRDGGKGALQGMLTPTSTPTVKAGFLGNRSLMVSEGTTLKCVLRTHIVAMKPGFVICRLAEPLMSANGKVILAGRGSKVTGEQNGSMRNGETRLYVLWRRIETSDGVTINIDAPGADALGGSGIDGEVDNHWSQRIGASLMLSLVNDAFAYEIAKASSSSATAGVSNIGNTAFQNTTQSGNKIAEKVLDSTINIPPTLYRNQGDQIVIMVPRDLDFSSVYDIQPK